MMERDTVTHGCFMVASSGIALRARYISQESAHSPNKRPRLNELNAKSDSTRTSNRATIQTLVSHLRAYFWESYQNPHVERPLPPSLRQAKAELLEQAIIDVAVELQHKGDASSYSISIDWHKTFVKLVQDGGLYRFLSADSKWKIFAIGQELDVFAQIAKTLLHKYNLSDLDWLDGLQPHDLADWFLRVHMSESESGWPHASIWVDILGISLDAALAFQEEFPQARYDVITEDGPASWISHPSMREMLRRQLKYWRGTNEGVPLQAIELVVKVALHSYNEAWKCSDNDENLKEEFAGVQKSAISLLRMVSGGNDELAFELSGKYGYFEGLCEISVAHERKADAALYALDPMFSTMQGRDLLNNLTFPLFVLQWHVNRSLYGHAINYGRHCVNDLNFIMERNSEMRKYRWIPALRQGHYDRTTELCLENCKENKGLKSTLWSLSMAKLTNKLVASQNQKVQQRQQEIEKKFELVSAQKQLLGDEVGKKGDSLLSSDELVELALEKLGDTFETDEKVRLALVGLAVCTSIEDTKAVYENISRIWAECLLADGAKWSDWAFGGAPLEIVREEASTDTVFGLVLEECRREKSLSKVTYGRHIEGAVIDRVADDNREGFIRVLRSFATPDVQGESLALGSIDLF
mmetsp:Transcript_2053/g.3755  ORF Transcript_2053/g.3755 Transcript_2053/m.3755 type:complete len:640 (+) Transcript_2053:1-1920(+)